MKILIDGFDLSLKQGTGLATYAKQLAETLVANGHEVGILFGVSGIGRNSQLHWPRLLQSLETSTGEPRGWLRQYAHLTWFMTQALVRRPLQMTAISRNPAHRIEMLPQRLPDKARFYNIPLLYRAAQAHASLRNSPLYIRQKPDIDLFHLTAAIPLHMPGVANVVTVHDLIPLKLPQSTEMNLARYRKILQVSLARADMVFSVSEHTKNDLVELMGLPEERVHVTYQSVAIPRFLQDMEASILERFLLGNFGLKANNYLLYYGAIEPKKNLTRLLDAYAMAKTDLPLVVAGKDGWLHHEEVERLRLLSKKQQKKSTSKRIRRFKYLPYNQLMMLLKGARALVFPSLYEGFGLPVLEAMRMGTPVITSNTTALAEVGKDAACLVHPLRVDEIADAMDRLTEDDSLHAQMITKGLLRADWFSAKRHMQRIDAGYRKVLSGWPDQVSE